tara:strand:- start:329 stop:463 length:135 start_codon:yes stop_codon:yes gene_type:complete
MPQTDWPGNPDVEIILPWTTAPPAFFGSFANSAYQRLRENGFSI